MNPIPLLIMIVMIPVVLIMWNRSRCKGKLLCFVLRNDKSLVSKLCVLKSSFVFWEDRAYDVYPDFIRLCRFPMGWPAALQELVPAALYDEENAIPLDWLTMEPAKERSMEVRAGLDENWLKKTVQETAAEGGSGLKFNWRKVFPILLIGIGVIGLIFILSSKGCAAPGGV